MNSLEIAKNLISFPTISSESNLDLIKYVSNYFDSYGVRHSIIENQDHRKANIIATIGPEQLPGIVLSGHTDVVPIEKQNWKFDPFSPVVIDEKLYGRGAADMKGFIASVLACVPAMCKANLKRPIHIFLTSDEEVNCAGARTLINYVKETLMPIQLACIVGEPSEMCVINEHKNIRILKTTIKSLGGHSSVPSCRSNALLVASKLILYLDELAKKQKENASNNYLMNRYITVNTGILNAGSAVNIIPNNAELIWEYRTPAGLEKNNFFEQFLENCNILANNDSVTQDGEISIVNEELSSLPALDPANNAKLTKFMLDITGVLKPKRVSYCSEAGLYQKELEIPTIICGPGSIKQAHKENEYIELMQISKAESLIKKLVYTLCGDFSLY